MPQKSLEMDDKAQFKRFHKAAKEAGCEDSEERFQDVLRTVAKAKPSGKQPDQRDGGEQRAGRKGKK